MTDYLLVIGDREALGWVLSEQRSIRLRRPLVKDSDRDATRLQKYLYRHQPQPLAEVLEAYARWWQPTARR